MRVVLEQPLIAREEQILFALADGLTYLEIAGELQLSLATVKDYAKTMRAKLGAHNSAHSVALAYHLGLLQPRCAA